MLLLRQFLIAVCLSCSIVQAAELRPYVVDIQTAVVDGDYFAQLLVLALNASKAPDEVIQLRFSPDQLSQARWIAAVAQGKGNNIIWTMTSSAREEILRPIRIPLMKGLMGYRVLVIRKGDEALFAHIQRQSELLAFSAGQGIHWPDTDILRANHFQILEAMAKENLYKMLAAKRFDFFPRGITEIQLEQNLIRERGFQLAPRILLHYPTDLYFFVNKANADLATRLEKGLSIILKNGEFDKLFFGYERMRAAVELLNNRDNRVIELENPFLSQETRAALNQYCLTPEYK